MASWSSSPGASFVGALSLQRVDVAPDGSMRKRHRAVYNVQTINDMMRWRGENSVVFCLKMILYPKRLYYCYQSNRVQGLHFILAHQQFVTDILYDRGSLSQGKREMPLRENMCGSERKCFPQKIFTLQIAEGQDL